MRKNRNNFGFSLTEVLLALGTLSIGMIFVAGVFPVAIYFSTQASEQTIAAVVADEAFAKIRLYGESDPDYQNWLAQPPVAGCNDFTDFVTVALAEFAYPSDPTIDVLRRRYWWSALLRRASLDPTSRLVQVTVFISRRTGAGGTYWGWDPGDEVHTRVGAFPVPVPVAVRAGSGPSELEIDESTFTELTEGTLRTFINDGYVILDNDTGQLYRVLERRRALDDVMIVLDRNWIGPAPNRVWVIPPPVSGGRYPCIAVYQKVIRF